MSEEAILIKIFKHIINFADRISILINSVLLRIYTDQEPLISIKLQVFIL